MTISRYDEWIRDDAPLAALTLHEWLVPVEGRDAVVFPPTYAKPERKKEEDWLGYNVDELSDGTKVCLIDSVGSQANRMEPVFMRGRYSSLVPQVTIEVHTRDGVRKINLLEAGHRAADAVVRFSDLADAFREAFLAYREGDATPMAKLAPTSLVFGAWDSRSTQVKLPRIVRSVIRAYATEVLHRSAQYIPPVDYIQDGAIEELPKNADDKVLSEWGLRHAPAAWSHGGVIVRREIRRDGVLNLTSLRALGTSEDGEATLKLRRYVLGLALVAFTADMETTLRQGCELVPDPEKPAEWFLVSRDGTREPVQIRHEDALEFALAAANDFGVGDDRQGTFDPKQAKKAIEMDKAQRKAARRGRGGAES